MKRAQGARGNPADLPVCLAPGRLVLCDLDLAFRRRQVGVEAVFVVGFRDQKAQGFLIGLNHSLQRLGGYCLGHKEKFIKNLFAREIEKFRT